MNAPSSWELWRKDFRRRVKEHMKEEGLRYRDLADMLGYADASGVSYQLGGRGPSDSFVAKMAETWPEKFGQDVRGFWNSKGGGETHHSDLQARQILAAVRAVRDAFDELEQVIINTTDTRGKT